jgi:glutathionylspermidine synthase
MKREKCAVRPDWRKRCEDAGFSFHSIDGVYWDEGFCYRFTAEQIDDLEHATADLYKMCMDAAEHIIAKERFKELAIPQSAWALIRESWDQDHPSLFGRFDLAWNGSGPPKLLEYNADTPTSLIEGSVAQWHWLEDVKPGTDQFNSLHEKLIAQWQWLKAEHGYDHIHFTCVAESEEDGGNLDYLRDTAMQAGIDAPWISIEEIGWSEPDLAFVDMENDRIETLFKLYPWEWLLADSFGDNIRKTKMRIIEPAWKMMLANKGLLPILWELFPNHPLLLPASFDRHKVLGDYVKKPLLSREGANVEIYKGGEVIRADGTYGEEGFVYQQYTPIANFDGNFVTIGSWIVGDEPAGIGLREDATEITMNTSRFLPHYFE